MQLMGEVPTKTPIAPPMLLMTGSKLIMSNREVAGEQEQFDGAGE